MSFSFNDSPVVAFGHTAAEASSPEVAFGHTVAAEASSLEGHRIAAAVASDVGSSWWTVVQMAVAGMGLTTGGPTVELVGTAGHPAPIAGEILVQMVIAGEVWG